MPENDLQSQLAPAAKAVVPLTRSDWLRLGFGCMLSLTLHGLLLSQIGPASGRTDKTPAALQIRLRPVAMAAPVETGHETVTLVAPEETESDTEQPAETAEDNNVQPENDTPSLNDGTREPAPDVTSNLPSSGDSPIALPPGLVNTEEESITYYSPKEVQVRPVPQSSIAPFPPGTLPPELTGKVIAKLYISATGQVVRIEPDEGNLPADILAIILERFKQVTFSPAQLNGQAVASFIRVEVWLTPEPTQKTEKPPAKPVYVVPPRIVQ